MFTCPLIGLPLGQAEHSFGYDQCLAIPGNVRGYTRCFDLNASGNFVCQLGPGTPTCFHPTGARGVQHPRQYFDRSMAADSNANIDGVFVYQTSQQTTQMYDHYGGRDLASLDVDVMFNISRQGWPRFEGLIMLGHIDENVYPYTAVCLDNPRKCRCQSRTYSCDYWEQHHESLLGCTYAQELPTPFALDICRTHNPYGGGNPAYFYLPDEVCGAGGGYPSTYDPSFDYGAYNQRATDTDQSRRETQWQGWLYTHLEVWHPTT